MLASLSPPIVGLKWLKPTPLSRKRGKQLGACPSAHPLRAEAASAPSRLSCTQLLSQALKRSNHLQGLLAASASPELWVFFPTLALFKRFESGYERRQQHFFIPSYCGNPQRGGVNQPLPTDTVHHCSS